MPATTTTEQFQSQCFSTGRPTGHTYNASHPFPYGSVTAVPTPSGAPVVSVNGTFLPPSATGSAAPSAYTGAATSMNVGLGSLVGLGAVAAFFVGL
ncbi:hypothetical protein LTR62_001479 [Meristemomyces frigidus]|uniref:Uncharacterized protein n=1 Tax=Meristemomyces frigidus TaxID=1508187 RepID=A0AAN7TG58_9PEZI|nr:hypothetical protein LTR62_001479 [Meristemomyces frigidus]